MFSTPVKLQPAWLDKARKRSSIDSDTGCWLYNGEIVHNGYGRLHYKGKNCRVHRLSYEYFVGSVPAGKLVCHSCDVRNCWNPDHLFLGSSKDNYEDMRAKGRIAPLFIRAECAPIDTPLDETKARGSRVPTSKLSDVDIPVIRQLYREEGVGFQALGRRYGVSHKTIADVINGRTWRHVSSP